MSLAFLFPGQGSQAIGMGQTLADAFPSAREVFQEVDDALGQRLFRLMSEGPEDQLTLTENAQPALMAVSLAVIRALKVEFGVGIEKAAFVAGHSLGEYSALAAAEALTLTDAARLLKLRGQAMQRAVPVGEGRWPPWLGRRAMSPWRKTPPRVGSEWGCLRRRQRQQCRKRGDLGRQGGGRQGHGASQVARRARHPAQCLRAFPLSPDAARRRRDGAGAGRDRRSSPPKTPLVTNVTARPTLDPELIRKLLVEQVTGRRALA